MAELEVNKPKTEKTSASATSTLPRLCPTTKLYIKDISCNTLKAKNPSLRNRSNSNENQNRIDLVDSPKNLHKSKLTEFNHSEIRHKINSLTSIWFRGYRGSIPIPNKNFLTLGMSPPVTRSPSPLKKAPPKELKSSNKIKTICLDPDAKKKTKICSRSPSPIKSTVTNHKRMTHGLTSPEGAKNVEKAASVKRADGIKKNVISPRTISPKKTSKPKVLSSSNMEILAKDKIKNESVALAKDLEAIVIKQTSQPSLCNKEKFIQPQEKISLDHLTNEVYAGDHKKLSFEKVHQVQSKRSYLLTYSTKDNTQQGEISLSFLQNVSSKSITNMTSDQNEANIALIDSKKAIRTISGHELILTPSIKLEMDKSELGCEDFEIAELLHATGECYEDLNFKDLRICQDDANEYDSEMSTDGEAGNNVAAIRSKSSDGSKNNSRSLWKSREAELYNDVDYRQSVYHPAVLRQHTEDHCSPEFTSKSKQMEDTIEFSNDTKGEIVRRCSSQLKNKYYSQNYVLDKNNLSIERSWDSSVDKPDGLPRYGSVVQDIPIYNTITGIARIRTKKQRVSGALLRFTLKIIRLLALFNLWPGDFCHLVTSPLTTQSLRLAR